MRAKTSFTSFNTVKSAIVLNSLNLYSQIKENNFILSLLKRFDFFD